MKLSRRNFLAGAAAASLLLPFERLTSRARAQTASPKRLLVVLSVYGTEMSEWRPTAEGRNFNYRRILEPLTPYKNKVLTISGVGLETAARSGADGHLRGMVAALTGADFHPASHVTEDAHTAFSIDQHVADLIGRDTRLRSLETALEGAGDGCYSGPNQAVPMLSNTHEIWQRAFAEFSPTGTPAPTRNNGRSILDFQTERARSISQRLAGDDRRRMDEYMTTLRDLERRIGQTGGSANAACSVPAQRETGGQNAQRLRDHADLTLAALTCGITNVATMSWAPTNSHEFHNLYRYSDHNVSHKDPTEFSEREHVDVPQSALIDLIVQRCRWQAEEFARLLAHFESIPEGDGTMLDNTLILWANDMHEGTHSHRDVPYVLAGNVKDAAGQSYFDSGRHIRFPDETPINRLLLTIAKSYGSPLNAFGDVNYSGPELSELRRG